MLVAAIDIGSNSTRLLVAEVDAEDRITPLERRSTVTRLAQGVDGSGALAHDAMGRVFDTLGAYRDLITDYRVEGARAAMTSAVRDASNGQAFRDRIARELGIDARIYTGDEEANLTFAGAMSERPDDDATRRVVIDIGGGSTEFVVGTGHEPSFHVSTQVGVVRHSERHLRHDPSQQQEVEALSQAASAAFAATIDEASRDGVQDAVAVAGTATSCAAMIQRLEPYDAARVEGYRLSFADLDALVAEVSQLSEPQRRELPGLHPDRAATIVAGTVLLREALRAFGLESVEVSEHDLLRGLALQIAGHQDGGIFI